ncbi:MAG: nucleotidyltransferase domain-containing protein [Pirellulales bacterium]
MRTIRELLGEDATVLLYGSRTADDRRGGDVDLLIESSAVIDVRTQAILHDRLERELCLPVDVSFIDPRAGMNRFQRLAAASAVAMEAAP